MYRRNSFSPTEKEEEKDDEEAADEQKEEEEEQVEERRATPPMRELALHRVSSFARMDLLLDGVACQCARARVSVLHCDCCK